MIRFQVKSMVGLSTFNSGTVDRIPGQRLPDSLTGATSDFKLLLTDGREVIFSGATACRLILTLPIMVSHLD